MAQRTFYVPRTVGPLQVELPEFKIQGRKGALHIRPSSTLFLSDDEVNHLKEKETVLFGKLRETTPKRRAGAKPPSARFIARTDVPKVADSSEGTIKEEPFTGRRKKKDNE